MDHEQFAKAIYEARHEGLKNCWSRDAPGLDEEHPDTRAYFLRIASNLLAKFIVEKKVDQ